MSVAASQFSQIASRSLMKVGQNYREQPQVPAAKAVPKSTLDEALETAGRGFAWCIALEKKLSAPFAKVPYPGMGAARILDFHAGLPHGHAHWPLPNVPLPSVGPLIPIPKISGADKTKIQDQWAARCGDFGLGIWCGGYMPMNEIFFGSASVWIESCRAARTLDITDHCILFDPSTCGVAKGAVVDSSDNVKIGGAPMPSLTQAAIAAAMKVVVKVVAKGGKAVARATASVAKKAFQKVAHLFKGLYRATLSLERRTLSRFLDHVNIVGNKAFKKGVREDLTKLSRTRAGRQMMDEAVNNGTRLEIRPTSDLNFAPYKSEPFKLASDFGKGPSVWADDVADWGRTKPTGSRVFYDPGVTTDIGPNIGKATSDTTLVHELSHANNMGGGKFNNTPFTDQDRYHKYLNPDEHQAVQIENLYRQETGQPLRPRYWNAPAAPTLHGGDTLPGA